MAIWGKKKKQPLTRAGGAILEMKKKKKGRSFLHSPNISGRRTLRFPDRSTQHGSDLVSLREGKGGYLRRGKRFAEAGTGFYLEEDQLCAAQNEARGSAPTWREKKTRRKINHGEGKRGL